MDLSPVQRIQDEFHPGGARRVEPLIDMLMGVS
jgi:hypothetical protein